MKVVMEFDLPAEAAQYHNALNGAVWRDSLIELDGFLRDIVLGDDIGVSLESAQIIRERMHVIIEDNGLDLYGGEE